MNQGSINPPKKASRSPSLSINRGKRKERTKLKGGKRNCQNRKREWEKEFI